MGPVAHVASGDSPELIADDTIADGALNDEDQFVAEVAMAGKLGARLEAEHERPALGGRVLPQDPPLDPGLALFPGKIADGDDARHRLHDGHGRLLLWPSVSRPPINLMPIFLFPYE